MPTYTLKFPPLLRQAALLLPLLCLSWLAQAQNSYLNAGSLSYQTSGVDNQTVQFKFEKAVTAIGRGLPPPVGTTVATPDSLYFGDGTAPQNVLLTVTSRGVDSYVAEYTASHTYAAAGTFAAAVRGCCRVNSNRYAFATQVHAGSANASPVATPRATVLLSGGSASTYQVPASDPNGDALTYSLATAAETGDVSGFINPRQLSIDSRTGLLSVNTTARPGVFYTAVVKVSDGATTIVLDQLIKLVGSTPANVAPTFVAPTPANGQIIRGQTGQPVTFTVRATDADAADVVTLRASGLPAGAVLTPALPASGNPAQATFTFTPTEAQTGYFTAYTLTFTAQDSQGAQTTTTVALETYRNLGPGFYFVPSATINGQLYADSPNSGQVYTIVPGQTLRFAVAADDRTDPNERVTLRALDLPPGATFTALPPPPASNGAKGAFSFTPTDASVGRYAVTFQAEDLQGLRTDLYVNIVVVANAAPVFTAPTPDPSRPIVAVAGRPVSFTVRATDADAGDVVTLDAPGGLPAGAELVPALPLSGNPVQTTFTWTPQVGVLGLVTLRARDSRGAQSIINIQIQVLPEPLCDPMPTAPVARADQFTAACGPITITRTQLLANDTDPQGRPLQITQLGGSSNATITSNPDGTISFVPTPGFVGTTSFTYLLQLAGPVLAAPATGHYYEFVSAPGICWNDAKAAAAARTYNGQQGYLTTITSRNEAEFVRGRAAGNYWLGASDAAVEGEWRWQTGPEAGQQFWQGGNSFIFNQPATGAPVAGRYNNWAPGEPNDYKNQFRPDGEDYASLFAASALWNDLDACGSGSSIAGYVVEFGGLEACTPVLYATGTVTVNVTASPPVGGNAFVNTTSGTPVVLTPAQLVAFSTDRQGRPLQVASVGTPTSGTIAANADGTYTYSPVPGFVGNITIPYVVQVAGPALASAATGHYYEFVSAPGLCWSAARAAAAARTFEGIPGYLATITSAAETDFLRGRAAGNYWFGAADDSVEGKWRWKTGPEAGQQFWEGAANGTALAYSNWTPGQPDNFKNQFRPAGEDYAQFYGGSGLWNDLDACGTGSSVAGYLVEYGGGPSTCTPVLYAASTVFVRITAANAAPPAKAALASTSSTNKSAGPPATLEALPNPSAGQFRLRVSTATERTAQLDVYDMQGRRVKAVFAGSLRAGEVRELAVDAPELAAGVYLVRLQSGRQVQHLRIVVQK